MVQGSVRESDGRIYLTVRLIDLERNAVVWGDTFERDRAELVGLAPLVARSVTQALGVSLSPAQASMLASRQTRNAEAYDWYLLGRRSSMSRSEAGLLKSIECFDKALAADPGYALALSEKAISLITLAGLPGHPPERPLREAQAIAGEALRLMPDLAEAHLSLGAVYQRLYWNWAEALR
jgi:tetratricopeptide (TPR) repeat protein